MSHRVTIRVHYPLESGRIELRTERDWEAVVESDRIDPGGTRFEFDLAFDAPYCYFKPVWRDGGTTRWSQGDNYLALADGKSVLDVYPYFRADMTCSVCNRVELPAADSGRSHALRVFYPPGYAENVLATYPVLYMQDGQNLFFAQEAFAGQHWKVEETLRILDSMNLLCRVLVAGIYPLDRAVDYTAPGYEAYGRYLVEQVKPWIDGHYRTRPGPESTAVLGSSLGGVASFYLGWQWPQVFGKVAALSSTFGWRDDLFRRVAEEEKRDVHFYLDSGWPRDNYEVTRQMRDLLLRRGYREGQDLSYLAFPMARHDEQAWSMRAHIPFQLFFGRS